MQQAVTIKSAHKKTRRSQVRLGLLALFAFVLHIGFSVHAPYFPLSRTQDHLSQLTTLKRLQSSVPLLESKSRQVTENSNRNLDRRISVIGLPTTHTLLIASTRPLISSWLNAKLREAFRFKSNLARAPPA